MRQARSLLCFPRCVVGGWGALSFRVQHYTPVVFDCKSMSRSICPLWSYFKFFLLIPPSESKLELWFGHETTVYLLSLLPLSSDPHYCQQGAINNSRGCCQWTVTWNRADGRERERERLCVLTPFSACLLSDPLLACVLYSLLVQSSARAS